MRLDLTSRDVGDVDTCIKSVSYIHFVELLPILFYISRRARLQVVESQNFYSGSHLGSLKVVFWESALRQVSTAR